MRRFDTTIQEDEAMLASPHRNLSAEERAAKQAVLFEKQILATLERRIREHWNNLLLGNSSMTDAA